jgi:hypothetical protein
MKTRIGFVSNSSSSSFVLAIRNDCTLDDIKKEILKDKKSLIDFAAEDLEYMDESEDFKELEDEELYIALAETISKKFLNNFKTCINLDSWKVIALEAGSEDNPLLESYVYSYLSNLDTDKIKIESFG